MGVWEVHFGVLQEGVNIIFEGGGRMWLLDQYIDPWSCYLMSHCLKPYWCISDPRVPLHQDTTPKAALPHVRLPRATLPYATLPRATLPHATLPHATLLKSHYLKPQYLQPSGHTTWGRAFTIKLARRKEVVICLAYSWHDMGEHGYLSKTMLLDICQVRLG
jgi:hypothetical protein